MGGQGCGRAPRETPANLPGGRGLTENANDPRIGGLTQGLTGRNVPVVVICRPPCLGWGTTGRANVTS